MIARYVWVRELLMILRNFVREGGGQKYFVRRGAINWDTHEWVLPHAVSVRLAENFPARGGQPAQTTVSLNVGMRLPSTSQPENLDDETLEQLETDMVNAMRALCQAKSGNDNLIFDAQFEGSVEWHSTDFGVQGYVVTFSLMY